MQLMDAYAQAQLYKWFHLLMSKGYTLSIKSRDRHKGLNEINRCLNKNTNFVTKSPRSSYLYRNVCLIRYRINKAHNAVQAKI